MSIVTKPKLGLRRFIEDASADLASAVKAASHANVNRLRWRIVPSHSNSSVPPKFTADTSSMKRRRPELGFGDDAHRPAASLPHPAGVARP